MGLQVGEREQILMVVSRSVITVSRNQDWLIVGQLFRMVKMDLRDCELGLLIAIGDHIAAELLVWPDEQIVAASSPYVLVFIAGWTLLLETQWKFDIVGQPLDVVAARSWRTLRLVEKHVLAICGESAAGGDQKHN